MKLKTGAFLMQLFQQQFNALIDAGIIDPEEITFDQWINDIVDTYFSYYIE